VKAIFQELKKERIKDAEVVIYYDPSIQYMPEEFVQFELSPWVKDIRFVQRPDPKTNARILVDGEKARILFYHDRKLTKSKVIRFSDDVRDGLEEKPKMTTSASLILSFFNSWKMAFTTL